MKVSRDGSITCPNNACAAKIMVPKTGGRFSCSNCCAQFDVPPLNTSDDVLDSFMKGAITVTVIGAKATASLAAAGHKEMVKRGGYHSLGRGLMKAGKMAAAGASALGKSAVRAGRAYAEEQSAASAVAAGTGTGVGAGALAGGQVTCPVCRASMLTPAGASAVNCVGCGILLGL